MLVGETETPQVAAKTGWKLILSLAVVGKIDSEKGSKNAEKRSVKMHWRPRVEEALAPERMGAALAAEREVAWSRWLGVRGSRGSAGGQENWIINLEAESVEGPLEFEEARKYWFCAKNRGSAGGQEYWTID